MGKKARKISTIRRGQDRAEGPADRFRRVLEICFGGNQSAMAVALGVSQAIISCIVAGKKPPGPKLRMALSKCPGVNPHWAMSGEGEALLAVGDPAAPKSWRLPLVHRVLPGLPLKYPEFLPGPTFAVTEEEFGASRYWLELGSEQDLVGDPELDAHPGDLVLLDADRRIWATKPQRLHNRTCGLRFHRGGEPLFALGRVFCKTPKQAGDAEHSRQSPRVAKIAVKASPVKKSIELWAKEPRSMASGPTQKSTKAASINPGEGMTQLQLADVVAVAIMLIRRL